MNERISACGALGALGVVLGYSPVNAAATVDLAAKQEILRVDNQWAEAENRRDAATLRSILDDQFIAVFATGKVVHKDQFIKSVVDDNTDVVTSQQLSDVTVLIDGDTAVVSETDTIRGTADGRPYVNVLAVTSTFMNRQGRWVALAERFGRVVDLAADEAAIRKADTEWVKAAQTKKVDAWLAFYTDEAEVLPPNDKVAHGRENARKSVGELLGLPHVAISWEPTKLEVARAGDLAYLTGTYTLKFTDDHGKTVHDRGKILEVWSKQADGGWKCSADTWNSDYPAT